MEKALNLKQLLIRIKNMKDRDGLSSIIGAAEARDSILSNIEGKRTRAAMWEKVMKLGLVKGDTVYIHVGPRPALKNLTAASVVKQGVGVFTSKKHHALWGKPLTVKAVKPRVKEIAVHASGFGETTLSPFECASLKLSKEPTPEALSHALQGRMVERRFKKPFGNQHEFRRETDHTPRKKK